ncbi:phosphotransacetylase [Malacoplasma penetrans]|uniref:Phosphotransacetylase n=1 Tax=Malacoplasma penetrans (strain HF-2) TaxID=272633 RepID=Q8EVQ7_MALP2|nr:phosphotransacetylase [Malacoplasma penetrans]RXY96310.1 phosphotransacetylase [Malacoplasma penetrans]BAC44293.1 phosphotransacetylase [Malacoplasma penetrans HF-2]
MKIIQNIKKDVSSLGYKPTIVYAEGWNKTIQEAATQVKNENLVDVVVIFRTQEELNGFNNTANVKTIVIENSDLSQYANLLFDLRKEKGLSYEDAVKLSKEPNYLACLMVKSNENWGAICGIEYTTKDTLRAALQVIKAKKGSIVNSIMILEREDKSIFASDIGLVINPSAEELSKIVYNCVDFIVNTLKIVNNNVAMLSYSTNGSGAGESVDKVKQAFELYKTLPQNPHANVYGEIQFDAAVDSKIRSKKSPDCTWSGDANVFVFPNLDAGNISYKILQRYAGFEPTGPIIIGLDKPVNDLSRGAGLFEVVSLSYVTALQTKN